MRVCLILLGRANLSIYLFVCQLACEPFVYLSISVATCPSVYRTSRNKQTDADLTQQLSEQLSMQKKQQADKSTDVYVHTPYTMIKFCKYLLVYLFVFDFILL